MRTSNFFLKFFRCCQETVPIETQTLHDVQLAVFIDQTPFSPSPCPYQNFLNGYRHNMKMQHLKATACRHELLIFGRNACR